MVRPNKRNNREVPGGPVVRTPRSHCRGPRFIPWSGNEDLASHTVWPKKLKNERKKDEAEGDSKILKKKEKKRNNRPECARKLT